MKKCVVKDFESVRTTLFDAAAKVLKSKEQKYASALGVSPNPVGLSVESYGVSDPGAACPKSREQVFFVLSVSRWLMI